jgi:aflatoxin B1 aldehyde reductase
MRATVPTNQIIPTSLVSLTTPRKQKKTKTRRHRIASSNSNSNNSMTKTTKKDVELAIQGEAVVTILGTMTFGWTYSSTVLDKEQSEEIIMEYIKNTKNSKIELDTAIAYANGETEVLLGKIFSTMEKDVLEKISIATKANPWGEKMKSTAGEGGLERDNFRKQVGILYLHAPDSETRLFEVLETAQGLFKSGAFKELGLSNMAAWEVARAHAICKENNFVVPTIYQGMYNALTREVEPELIPALKSLNMRFVAYNPLAGGLLTGKHTKSDEEIKAGRFKNNDMYKNRFWNDCYFDAVEIVKKSSEECGISPTEASLRWLYFHSKLSGKKRDAVIIGASSLAQCRENLLASEKGPLPTKMVSAFDEAYEKVRSVQPPYFRGTFLID